MSGPASDRFAFPAPAAAGAGDALTLAFADAHAGVYGYARVAVERDGAGAHSLVAVFGAGRALALTSGPAPLPGAPGGDGLALSGADGEHWSAAFAGGEQGAGSFALRCEPLGPAAGMAIAGGERTVLPVAVRGELRGASGTVALEAIGQVSLARLAGAPEASLTREVALWEPERLTIDLYASRERRRRDHEHETLGAVIVEHEPGAVLAVDDPRLSTTYDGDGRPLRAGLELWPDEESVYPRRAAGDTLCAATLQTPTGRWDVAYLRWRIEGGTGIGPYVLWRALPR